MCRRAGTAGDEHRHPEPLKTRGMAEKKDSKTKNFVLRIDGDSMKAIEAWAADEFRSVNGQLQWIIAEALRKAHSNMAE